MKPYQRKPLIELVNLPVNPKLSCETRKNRSSTVEQSFCVSFLESCPSHCIDTINDLCSKRRDKDTAIVLTFYTKEGKEDSKKMFENTMETFDFSKVDWASVQFDLRSSCFDELQEINEDHLNVKFVS